MTTLKILQIKQGKTLKGKPKLEFKAKGQKGEFWFYSNVTPTPQSWKVGDNVTVELEQFGKSWWIKSDERPEKQSNGNGHDSGVSYEVAKDIQDIKAKLEALFELVKGSQTYRANGPAISSTLDVQNPEESDDDGIPF